MSTRLATFAISILSLTLVACSQASAPVTSTPLATSAPPSPTAAASPPDGTPTAGSTASPTAAPATTPDRAPTPGATSARRIVYTIVPDGTEARYRVREQLADRSLPSDAIGRTNAVTGQVALDPTGKILPDQSKLVVDLTTLRSDSKMRDAFIQRNTLETQKYPTAEFVPTEAQGLPSPLPETGQLTFKLLGNLTIHGVTKPSTWDVTATVQGAEVTGQATTSIKFEDFGMTPPRAAVVLSVQDDVKLELDVHLRAVG